MRPGSYLTVSRTWKEGDKIALNFDMRGRLTELNGYQAIERGPVVLARDTRLGEDLSMKPASCKRVADMWN